LQAEALDIPVIRLRPQIPRRCSAERLVGSTQRFLVIHAATYDAFYHQRHLLRRSDYKHLRSGAFATWAQVSAA